MRILIIVSSAGLFGGGRRADAEARHVETAIRPVVLARGVDVGAGDQDVDGIDLDGRSRAGGRSTGEIGGYATGAEGDGKDDDTRGSHTLHFPRLRFGPHSADDWISPAKRQSMVNEAYLI
jgi:hypothetical protein